MATALRTAAFFLLFAAAASAQEGVPTGVSVGTALHTLAGVDLDGKPVKLQNYYGEGTMVLSFWSVHCTDCIRELDDLRSLRREFPAEQVSIVAVVPSDFVRVSGPEATTDAGASRNRKTGASVSVRRRSR